MIARSAYFASLTIISIDFLIAIATIVAAIIKATDIAAIAMEKMITTDFSCDSSPLSSEI